MTKRERAARVRLPADVLRRWIADFNKRHPMRPLRVTREEATK